MKRSRFSEEKILEVLREHEAGATVADLCRKQGMSSATCLGLEGQVWREGRFRCAAAQGAGGGEHEAEAALLRDLEGTVRVVCYLLVGLTAYSLLVDFLLPRL